MGLSYPFSQTFLSKVIEDLVFPNERGVNYSEGYSLNKVCFFHEI